MKDSIARARQIRTAEQTQAEVAEIKKQLDRIEDKLDRWLVASNKAGKKPAEQADSEKAGA